MGVMACQPDTSAGSQQRWCRCADDDDGVVEKDGKIYLRSSGTSAAALKRCQQSNLADVEHNKKYVKEGKIVVCKTTVALHKLYNAVASVGGFEEIKQVGSFANA